MLVYQAQLDNLCDQAMREEGQEKLREVMDQMLRLLAEQQRDSREVSTAHFVVPIRDENTSYEVAMSCKSCGSDNQGKFTMEMAVHFPGLRNIDRPAVWVFSELSVCLDCGTAEFTVPKAGLRELAKGDAAAAQT